MEHECEECKHRNALEKHFAEASEWLCDCGERCKPFAAEWRWNGFAWEHQHEYPLGHCIATHIQPANASGEGRPHAAGKKE